MKCINGEKATYNTSVFSSKRERTFQILLEDAMLQFGRWDNETCWTFIWTSYAFSGSQTLNRLQQLSTHLKVVCSRATGVRLVIGAANSDPKIQNNFFNLIHKKFLLLNKLLILFWCCWKFPFVIKIKYSLTHLGLVLGTFLTEDTIQTTRHKTSSPGPVV